jgi:hypothetical protein
VDARTHPGDLPWDIRLDALLLPLNLADLQSLVLRLGQDFRSVETVEHRRGVLSGYMLASSGGWCSGAIVRTDFLVEEDTEASGVHGAKLAKIIDDRVDDDPEVALLIVLMVSAGWVKGG